MGRSDAASHPAGLSDGGFVKRQSKRDKEREADGRQKRGGGLFGRAGERKRRPHSDGRGGSYCDNGEMERDRGRPGGGWLVLLLFNRLAVFS